jgi:hypothetical protein
MDRQQVAGEIEAASAPTNRPHLGGSNPFARQRSAMAGDVRAATKARAAAAAVLLAGIAAA